MKSPTIENTEGSRSELMGKLRYIKVATPVTNGEVWNVIEETPEYKLEAIMALVDEYTDRLISQEILSTRKTLLKEIREKLPDRYEDEDIVEYGVSPEQVKGQTVRRKSNA